MRSAPGSASTGDDNIGENGIDVNSPSNVGVVSSTFSLGYNSAPTDATFETGYMKAMDNVADTWADLTIDFVPAGERRVELSDCGHRPL